MSDKLNTVTHISPSVYFNNEIEKKKAVPRQMKIYKNQDCKIRRSTL